MSAADALDRLADACFAALGPASRYGNLARGNAGAVRSGDGPHFGEWLRCRASDWRDFASETDADLAALAMDAAAELDILASATPAASRS